MKDIALFIGAALVFLIVFSGLPVYAEKFKSPEEMFKETKYTDIFFW